MSYYHVCAYTIPVFYRSFDMNQVPEKLYFCQLPYNKNACSQCNLTAQTDI